MAKILRIFLFLHCFSHMLNIRYVASPVSVRSQKGNVCSLDLEWGQVFNERIWSQYSETLKMNQFGQSTHRLTMNRKTASHTTPPLVSLRETTSEKQLQKFHDDVLLSDLGSASVWSCREGNLVKHYLGLVSHTSAVWNFCTRFSDVTKRGNQWSPR